MAPETEGTLNDSAAVRQQYSTPANLSTRISIHSKYSTNRQGFGNWIVSHYGLRPGMSVLELGCGTGEMWLGKQEMIRGCARFVLSDFSEGMLEKARGILGDTDGIDYRVIDIQAIPFPDQSFDAVIANMMLYHVPDLSKGLGEVRRVLKQGGSFFCATFGERGMMDYICSLFSAYGVKNSVNRSFTLQNGESRLRGVFRSAECLRYEDALEVTDVEDMVDYICSLAGMSELRQLPRDVIRAVLEKNMSGGILRVPKEYGMFIAK